MFNSPIISANPSVSFSACKLYSLNPEQLTKAKKRLLDRRDCRILETRMSKPGASNPFGFIIFEKSLPKGKLAKSNTIEQYRTKRDMISYGEDWLAGVITKDLPQVHSQLDSFNQVKKLAQRINRIRRGVNSPNCLWKDLTQKGRPLRG